MILPVRLGSPEKPSRVPAAVRAFFTDKPEESADEKLKRARKDRDEWEQMARRLEAERSNGSLGTCSPFSITKFPASRWVTGRTRASYSVRSSFTRK
mgnify:CR=1 FL=1